MLFTKRQRVNMHLVKKFFSMSFIDSCVEILTSA